jgi:hypothetical protein
LIEMEKQYIMHAESCEKQRPRSGHERKKVDGAMGSGQTKMTRHDKPDDRGKDGARSIVAGKAGLAHACEYEGERMKVEANGGRGDRGWGR